MSQRIAAGASPHQIPNEIDRCRNGIGCVAPKAATAPRPSGCGSADSGRQDGRAARARSTRRPRAMPRSGWSRRRVVCAWRKSVGRMFDAPGRVRTIVHCKRPRLYELVHSPRG
ncbi:hypothetical protein BJA5080_07495 [Bradyrhizobium diazoefficiens SEMIA 5080]|uniref:Uncharacterized protein n=1 Tax=Bradyrhizobium diazoefficiens SEMIA 5080 TaxID=754504 RepID=A0A837C710_9BRAD|nr:hypothetical protein BJA5080_07495 [Bradyrhizobium diazoefficiens SEMIA 5080]